MMKRNKVFIILICLVSILGICNIANEVKKNKDSINIVIEDAVEIEDKTYQFIQVINRKNLGLFDSVVVRYRFLLDPYSNLEQWKEENGGLFYQDFSSDLRVSNIKQYQGGYFTVEYNENETEYQVRFDVYFRNKNKSYHWICNQMIDAKDYTMKKSSCSWNEEV